MLFKKIINAVQNRLPEAIAVDIQAELNSCLQELGLSVQKEVYEEWTVVNSQVQPFPDDVITVLQVFLNNEEIPNTWNFEEYVNGSSATDNSKCLVMNRNIYFPSALVEGTDTLTVLVNKTYTESDSLDKDDVISIPDYYLPLIVLYILKELTLYDT